MHNKNILIVALILGLSSIFTALNIQTAKATWVQGHITQDTTWRIQDSPFIVINDLVVDVNATLNIEAGAEIRFGGNFSLMVNGNFSAAGNTSSPILFTSNKLSPASGDWGTLTFSSLYSTEKNRFFTMRHCIVKHATQITIGTGVDGYGRVIVENCEISSCKNGIYIWRWKGDTLMVNRNTITSEGFGIGLCGEIWNGSISGNKISFCSMGFEMAFNIGGSYMGAWLKNSSVSNNIVSSCTYGISMSYASYYGLLINNNSISSSSYGIFMDGYFWESSDYSRPLITNNSIAYNIYGIFVGTQVWQTWQCDISFNDIYSNNHGMNVSDDKVYNATYNYWGDPSGPYHISINPTGKGNPVNGEGGLEFIPFLTAPHGTINHRPEANLEVDKTNPNVDETVTFDASSSNDDGRVDFCFFDFGDGTNSSWTPLSIVTHKYSAQGNYNAILVVMDDFGVPSPSTSRSFIMVNVVPEFTSFFILLLFMIATLLALVYRRKGMKTRQD